MTRLACALALLCGALAAPAAFTSPVHADQQAVAKTAPATPAPATPAKFYRPVKGIATVEVIQSPAKRVGNDMVTVLKVKNTSAGRINLLQFDDYWYDKDVKQVSGSTEKYRKPFNPGDIIEIMVKSPVKPNLYRNQIMFSHAGGKVEVKQVKKFQ
jgi:hypothetical protein